MLLSKGDGHWAREEPRSATLFFWTVPREWAISIGFQHKIALLALNLQTQLLEADDNSTSLL